MNNRLIICLLAVFVSACAPAAPTTRPAGDYPTRTLSDGAVKMLVYLPDAQRGLYRGARFDWSGVIGRVEYKGHAFYAPWKDTHDPGNHDDIIGPVSEFGKPGTVPGPLGYDEAKVGETFIKIGVGHLRKPREDRYAFDTRYEIVKPAEWKVDSGDGWIEFGQELRDDRGWGYQYTKRIELLKDKPGFVIRHRLKNTGTNLIDIAYYNHNFTKIDNTPIGPAYRLIFPFTPHVIEGKLDAPAQLKGRELVFTGDIAKGQALWFALDGYKSAEDNAVTIRNDKTGAAVQISGDETPIRFVYFGTNTCACPEMFIPIKLASGEEKSWKIRYVFAVDR